MPALLRHWVQAFDTLMTHHPAYHKKAYKLHLTSIWKTQNSCHRANTKASWQLLSHAPILHLQHSI
jgi:hypothetical protein